MQFSRIYVDTNVIIQAFEGSSDDDIAQDIVGMFGLGFPRPAPAFVTSHITLAEALVHPYKMGDVTAQRRYEILLSATTNWLQVRQISQSVLTLAARLRASGRLKLPDAIHLATAVLTNCSHTLTSDGDFNVQWPADLPPMPISIRTDRENLDQLIAWLRT